MRRSGARRGAGPLLEHLVELVAVSGEGRVVETAAHACLRRLTRLLRRSASGDRPLS